MAVFYNEKGQPEVWDECPDGYTPEADWLAAREAEAEAARVAYEKSPEYLEAVRSSKIDEIDNTLDTNGQKAIRSMIDDEQDIIGEIRKIQKENRRLRDIVVHASTVAEIQAIQPVAVNVSEILANLAKMQ